MRGCIACVRFAATATFCKQSLPKIEPSFHQASPMSFIRRAVCTLVSLAMLGGCATAGKDIAASYVSPEQYTSYDCQQLQLEMARIHGRVSQLTGRLDEAANNDKMIMGAGLLIFWPALFALGGTKQQEAELARLKGEYEAVQSASVAKKCSLKPEQPKTEEPSK